MKKFCKVFAYIALLGLLTLGLIFGYIYYDNFPEYDPNKINTEVRNDIERELQVVKNDPVSEDQINYLKDQIKKHKLPIAYYEIRSNKVSFHYDSDVLYWNGDSTNRRAYDYFKKIQSLISKGANFKDTSFFILIADAPVLKLLDYLDKSKMPPIFTFALNRNYQDRDKYILIPDDHTIANYKFGYRAGWLTISERVLKANRSIKWEDKYSKMIWIGANSNPIRKVLVNLSISYPDSINARITDFGAYSTSLPFRIYKMIALQFALPPMVSQKDQIRYKMLMNLDGTTSTYPGFLWRLLSNSVVLKQETDNIQWFYKNIKPWEHYVPVKEDLSDLEEKIAWVKEHDSESRKIAERSTDFVKNNLMTQNIDSYIVALINAYADINNNAL